MDNNFSLYLGDCVDVLRGFEDGSVDAIVTDPPYGLTQNKKGGTGVKSINLNSPAGRSRISVGNGAGGFMGKKWDSDVPSVDIWAECLRVLKPGGNLLCFAGTRTQHRMVARVVEAGFELQDMVLWTYGCLSEDTEVLTKEGWVLHSEAIGKDIQIFDIVTKECKWETPSQWYTYEVENDVAYSLRSEDTDQIVSRGHRCLTFSGDSLSFTTAEELRKREVVPVFDEHGAFHKSKVTVSEVEYSGVFWCPSVSTGAFVARRNGKVFITGNSGFPKSLNIAKAIDQRRASNDVIRPWLKSLGTNEEIAFAAKVTSRQVDHWLGENTPCPQTLTEERFILLCQHFGTVPKWADKMFKKVGDKLGEITHSRSGGEDFAKIPGSKSEKRTEDVTTTATDEAKQWEGWGTSLKPSFEPVSIYTKGDSLTLHSEFKRLYYCAKASKKERNLGLGDRVSTHPTVKPLKLMESLCELATPPGGTILDPFMGSGTTGIAALNLGFNFIGIDMVDEYFDIAQLRFNSLFPQGEE